MARNRRIKSSAIDFENDESIVDELAILRKSQDRLYKLDNPYVGSKRGILPDIADSFNRHGIQFNTMLDLFSGSSVVSIFFKLLGKQVISNDLLTSSYYNALSFVENEGIVLTKDQIDFMCHNNNPGRKDWVQKNFSNRFTTEEALFLDNYRANIDTLTNELLKEQMDKSLSVAKEMSPEQHKAWRHVKTRQVEITKALAIVLIEHYVMNRCFLGGRLNKGQILAELEHRLQHDRNDGHSMKFRLGSLPSFADGAKGCKAYNGDAILAAKEVRINHQIDLAYLDPPYGQAQSDYANMYQFCEEYIYSSPLDKLPHIEAASTKFAKAKNYKEHFREVLHALEFVPIWAVSFNASSFEDADGIVSILKEYKKDVIVVNIDHEYRYRKARSKAVEYLFIAR